MRVSLNDKLPLFPYMKYTSVYCIGGNEIETLKNVPKRVML